MLDEGMAVLYNTISNMLEQETLEENEEYEALIIDCEEGQQIYVLIVFVFRTAEPLTKSIWKLHTKTAIRTLAEIT